MKKLVCIRAFTSGLIPTGKNGLVAVGREFDVPEGAADDLIAKGFARPVVVASASAPVTGMTACASAEDED